MKELKTYISEGFFSNVGANNRIKLAIDTIKDASLNDKIDSDKKKLEFTDLLASILKDIETDIKKGKFIFKYIRNDGTCHMKTIISLEMTESKGARWIYSSTTAKFGWSAYDMAYRIAADLYYEASYLVKESRLRHSIANTIEVTEFKLS